MPNILIVESDTPAIISSVRSMGKMTAAEKFGRAFKSISGDISYKTIYPYEKDCSPGSIDFENFDGCVFTGSGVPWRVDEPAAQPLRQMMEASFDARKPVFGSCNGMQLATVVLGGECRAAPTGMEIGLACNITLNSVGQSHSLHCGRAEPYCALSIHRDQVSRIPDGAIVTAGNEHSPVQAMVYEQGNLRFWGTQYHPEYSITNIIDCISDADSLFYSKHGIIAALQAVKLNPCGAVAKRLGIHPNDLKPQTRRAELRNWLLSLD